VKQENLERLRAQIQSRFDSALAVGATVTTREAIVETFEEKSQRLIEQALKVR